MTYEDRGKLERHFDGIRELVELGAVSIEDVERFAAGSSEDELEEEGLRRLVPLISQPQFEARPEQELIVQKGNLVIPATEVPFVVKHHFVQNVVRPFIVRSSLAKIHEVVKMSHVGEGFQECYYGIVEEPFGGSQICYGDLSALSCGDNHVIAALGSKEKAKISLAEVFAILAQQPTGAAGPLLTSGTSNIFFVFGRGGQLAAIDIFLFGHGWRIDAHRVTGEEELYQGCRIFFRDPRSLSIQAA
ncbi:MAG: hypothetical protein WCF77_00140 [Minisyncoccia bacterium]